MCTKNHKMLSLLVFAVTILLSSRGGKAQSSGCSNNVISGLSSCISYLRGNSSRPLPLCCSALANVERSQPDCLCPMLSNGASFSLGIAANRTLAMALPTTCKLSAPQCHDVAADGPSASSPLSPPSNDEASSPPSTAPAATTMPDFDFPSGSKAVPSAAISIHLKTITTTTTLFMAITTTTLFMAAALNWI